MPADPGRRGHVGSLSPNGLPQAGARQAPSISTSASPSERGCVLWFTGLSGAGKSTVARLVAGRLQASGRRVELLDGDEVRQNLSKGLGFSRADRETNVRRIAFVAKLLARNGVIAITAAISPYRSMRAEARRSVGDDFLEVFVDCPLETCVARDVKGLYKKALAGEIAHFTGISDPYEPPADPELKLGSDREAPQESADRVLRLMQARGYAGEVGAGGKGGETTRGASDGSDSRMD